MAVHQPGMEIYGVLAEDFWPLIGSSMELHDEFITQAEYEEDPEAFIIPYLHHDYFKFVEGLLKDGEHRILNLTDKEDFLRSQQHISQVCVDLISFSKSFLERQKNSNGTRKSRGRPAGSRFTKGHILLGDASIKIRGNVPVTRFCEKMFKTPVKTPIHWIDLYVYVYQVHEAPPNGWRKLLAIIGRINEKMKDRKMDEIFDFAGLDSGEVTRLY